MSNSYLMSFMLCYGLCSSFNVSFFFFPLVTLYAFCPLLYHAYALIRSKIRCTSMSFINEPTNPQQNLLNKDQFIIIHGYVKVTNFYHLFHLRRTKSLRRGLRTVQLVSFPMTLLTRTRTVLRLFASTAG